MAWYGMKPRKSGYMLTNEQRQKAKQALLYSDLPMFNTKRWEQEHAYEVHLWACMMVKEYGLPYRILLAYFKKHGYEYLKCHGAAHNDNIVLINRLYPKPGYLAADLPTIDWYIRKYEINPIIRIESGPFPDDLTSSKWDFRTFIDDDVINAQIDEATRKQHTWDLQTSEGIKAWEHEFAHFLADEDFSKYTPFDFFGEKSSTPDKSKIKYWKKLQREYNKNPDDYRQEEPPYLAEYANNYTLWTFNIDYTDK